MLRLIVQTTDIGDAANVGGPINASFKTFDVDLPEVEALLGKKTDQWTTIRLVGVELLSAATTKQEEGGAGNPSGDGSQR